VSYFRQRYGDWILLDPPKTGVHLVVWLLPLLALLGGVTALALLFRRWRAAAESVPDAPDEDLERVRAALHAREDDA
jgi:cytochrome c-type biogenesis protein CcmH